MTRDSFKHYILGIPEMDDQHWELFEILNSIEYAVQSGASIENIRVYLDDFFNKLSEHCADEEKLMQSCNYPYYEHHKATHPESSMQLMKKKDLIDDHLPYIDYNTMLILLRDHIDHADQQYVTFYKKYHNLI